MSFVEPEEVMDTDRRTTYEQRGQVVKAPSTHHRAVGDRSDQQPAASQQRQSSMDPTPQQTEIFLSTAPANMLVLPSITIDAAALAASRHNTHTINIPATYFATAATSPIVNVTVTLQQTQPEASVRCYVCREPFTSHAAYRQHKREYPNHCSRHEMCLRNWYCTFCRGQAC